MADTTGTDVTKLKVVDLRKELKSRGLPYFGDKAELVTRLQAALAADSEDEHDLYLDSETDSESVLDEDKTVLDDSAIESINEELVLADQPAVAEPVEVSKPIKTLKRKITMSETAKEKAAEEKTVQNASKKIVLCRASAVPPDTLKTVAEKTEVRPPAAENSSCETNKIKIATVLDSKTRLEMRAKRFGLPVKTTEADRKEARKQRFGQNATKSMTDTSGSLTKSMDKLKQRAERFGQSVSKILTTIENKEKLEKRKAKFGTVK